MYKQSLHFNGLHYIILILWCLTTLKAIGNKNNNDGNANERRKINGTTEYCVLSLLGGICKRKKQDHDPWRYLPESDPELDAEVAVELLEGGEVVGGVEVGQLGALALTGALGGTLAHPAVVVLRVESEMVSVPLLRCKKVNWIGVLFCKLPIQHLPCSTSLS